MVKENERLNLTNRADVDNCLAVHGIICMDTIFVFSQFITENYFYSVMNVR